MNAIQFHPETTLVQAAEVAASQGCVLRAANGRIYLRRVQRHMDAAMQAAESDNYAAAQQHMQAARATLEEGCHA